MRNRASIKKLLIGLVLLLATGVASAQGETPVLHVDATQSLGDISPYVYGSNLGLYGVVPPSVMPQAQALNLRYLRYGGGASDDRNVQLMTVDLFVLQARQLGAEPAITVRLLNGTPEDAAAVVRHVNIERGSNVRYWSIGNEPNFFEAVMHAPSYTTEDLTQQWRAIAEAMLAVDPTIILVGPDISQYVVLNTDPLEYLQGDLGGDPTDDLGKDWMQEFLRANGDLVGVVSIHRYPYPGAGADGASTATIDGLRANTREWDTIIPNLRQIIRSTTGRDIPIGVTELNSNSSQSSGGEASLDSFYNAIWLSDVLGRLIRQQVEIVAYWDLMGDPGRSWGLMDRYGVRPTYYAYLMYTHFGTALLASDWSDPDVSIYAAKRGDGTLTLMVINLGADEKTATLALDGFAPNGEAEVWRFDDSHNAEQIDNQPISDGATITVPGQSVTLYAVPGTP